MGNVLAALNGREIWVYVVELTDGLRIRLALDEWESLGLHEGRRIPVRLPDRDDVWLFITSVTTLPPIVWVTMAKRYTDNSVSRFGLKERQSTRQ